MARGHTYPSPPSGQVGEGTHPFYGGNQQQVVSEDMQLQQQLMSENNNLRNEQSAIENQRIQPDMRGPPMPPPPQLYVQQAGGAVDQGQSREAAETPEKKRSKVSRACDECRRKKVAQTQSVLVILAKSVVLIDSMRRTLRSPRSPVLELPEVISILPIQPNASEAGSQ